MLGPRKGAESADAGPKASCGESRRARAGSARGGRGGPGRCQWDSLFPRQSGPSMQSPAEKEAGLRGPRERTGKGSLEERARGAPAAQPPKPGWALTLEGLAAMSSAQRHRHLLFGDQLEDVGAAASIFPRESVELGSRMPDPRAWTQSPEPPGVREDRLLGVLKAAEAQGRIRALRLRYIRMRVRLGAGRKGRAGERVAGRGGDTSPGAPRKGVGVGVGVGGALQEAAGGARAKHRRGLETRTPAPRPAGGGDLAPHLAAEVRARRHPAGAVPTAAAEAHADPRPPGSSRGAHKPGRGWSAGEGGASRPASPHTWPQPLSPTEEARGDHPGGES